MTATMTFTCSICEERSTRICVRCTKDTCSNHLCEKCGACSDCCDCEIHLEPESLTHEPAVVAVNNAGPHEPDEPRPHPMPDPDPAPEPDPMPHWEIE
jgi:hypothetical protein